MSAPIEIIWRDARGDDLPDDEITVLVGFADDQEVDLGFRDGGVWRSHWSILAFDPPPDCWAHTPEVPK